MMTFQFRIQIMGITKPPVWRRIEVDAATTFEEFHGIIQYAFGWEFSHLYLFSEMGFRSSFQIQDPALANDGIGEDGDSTKSQLKDIFKKEKQRYIYIYDFGDSWEHKITLEKISDAQGTFPVCLAGKGKCSPGDCGGVRAYQSLKEAINDPEHPDHGGFRDWVRHEEEDVRDPKEFDVKEFNSALKNY